MRCIFTNRTIGIGCFSIGTNRTIGTNGDPSYHHQHQWSLFVSIGRPSLQHPGLDVYMKEHVHLRNKHRQKKESSSKIVPTLRQGGFLFIPIIITIVFITITIINFGVPCDQRFSLAWLLAFRAFTISFAWLICRVVGLFYTPREFLPGRTDRIN